MRWKHAWLFGVGLIGILGLVGCKPAADKTSSRPVVLQVWTWWADQQAYYEKLAVEYEEQTGVKVKFVLLSALGADYFNKVQAAAQADMLPDIIGMSDQRELVARYASADRLLNLTQDLGAEGGAWRKSFHPLVMERFFYAAGNEYGLPGNSYWGVPMTVMNIQIFYNKELFVKAGLDPEKPPRTWNEFLTVSQKLKKAGVPPLLAGLGDLWVDYKLYNAYAWTYLGEQQMRALYAGELPYTDVRNVQALTRIQELKDVLYPGCVSMPNKDAEINFANGKAAMMINGSWAVNVYAGMNPNLKLGVFRFPKPDDAKHPMKVMGGIGKGFLVAANSKHPKEVKAFLKWLLSTSQQVRMAKDARELPANQRAMQDIDPLLKNFAAGMNELAPDLKLEEKKAVEEFISKGIQSLLMGESTPDALARDIQALKKQVLAENVNP